MVTLVFILMRFYQLMSPNVIWTMHLTMHFKTSYSNISHENTKKKKCSLCHRPPLLYRTLYFILYHTFVHTCLKVTYCSFTCLNVSILTDCLDHEHHLWDGWISTRMLLFPRWIIKDSIFSKTANHKPSSGCTGINKWLYLFCLTEDVTFLSFMFKPFHCYLFCCLAPYVLFLFPPACSFTCLS